MYQKSCLLSKGGPVTCVTPRGFLAWELFDLYVNLEH